MSAENVPEDLKVISPYLQRASELKEREPIVAYYCAYYAVKQALELSAGNRKKEVQDFLLQLMDRLEAEKKELVGQEAVTNDEVAKAYIENFALKIFMNADNQDRRGAADKKTAKTFLAASMFLELLKIFGPLDEEVEQKIKYSKWKTADIVKAIKEGRQPVAGPPGGDENFLDNAEMTPEEKPSLPPPSPRIPGTTPGLEPRRSMPDVGRTSPGLKAPSVPVVRPASSSGFTPAVDRGGSSNGIYPYDPKVLANAQKHARFAISALQYDDIETAVDNLQRALGLLEPYRK